MGLNIKNEQTERLIRELAAELQTSLTGAVEDAVRARLDQVRGERSRGSGDRVAEVLALAAELRVRLGADYLAQDFDALLYDERGLPR